MAQPLIWLAALELLGLLALPPAFLLFRRLPGRGYGFAKPLALVLVGYCWWLLGHVPVVPNSPWDLAVLLVVGGGVSGWLACRRLDALRQFLREEWKTILAAELVFLGFFFFWLAIVADVPQINHTEKPMDFAFFNAVLTAGSFPPEDPWLAGHSISYYYFGHLMLASVAKLTGIASPVSYNLAVATIPALLASGAFALVFSLVRLSGGSRSAATVFGVSAPALLMLIGNLEGGLELVHSLGWGGNGFWQWVGVKGLEGGGQGSFFPEQHWWWWRATRIIDSLAGGRSLDYTITEFPFFSFLLGDLHAHMMSLPFLVMFLGIGLNLFQTRGPLGLQWLRRHPLEAVFLSLLLGALAFINTWDFPVFAVILGLIIFARAMGNPQGLDSDYNGPGDPGAPSAASRPLAAAVQTLAMLVPVTAVAVVLFLPFYANFSSQASVALPVTGPGTRPFLFLVAIGFPFLLAAAFCLKQLSGVGRPSRADRPVVALAAGVCLAPLALWGIGLGMVAWLVGPETLGDLRAGNRLLLTGTLLGLAGLAGFSALQRVRLDRCPPAAFALLLTASALGLLALADLFYVLDFFGNRMNTVFKTYYQAWLLLAIAGAYGLYYLWSRRKIGGRSAFVVQVGAAGVGVALLAVSLYYPVGAIMDRTSIGNPGYSFTGKTLDGLAFLHPRDSGEYRAIAWFREEAPPGRLVEAVGGDYTDYGRVSSGTGRPTILGWAGHEHQWRGTTDPLEGRAEDVRQIYAGRDAAEATRLLQKYGVRYVYVGRRERDSYGEAGLTDFGSFMETVFASDGVTVYELPISGTTR